jgi:hypothetical protein
MGQDRGLDARLHLLDMHRMQTCVKYVRMAPPRMAEILPTPAKTNTTHTGKLCEQNLALAPTLVQGFGGYTCGCASAPPRNSVATRREERPISKHQPLRVPDGYHRRGSGATVGDSHKGPLITGENPIFSQITKTQMNSQIINYTQNNHTLVTGAHGPRNLSNPSNGQPQHPSGETPLRSRGTVSYRRNSASLEG